LLLLVVLIALIAGMLWHPDASKKLCDAICIHSQCGCVDTCPKER
jgi:hypothetical protein